MEKPYNVNSTGMQPFLPLFRYFRIMRFFCKILSLSGLWLYLAALTPVCAQKAAPVRTAVSCNIVQNGLPLKWVRITAVAALKLPARQQTARLPRKYQVYTTDATKLRAFMQAAGKRPSAIVVPLPEDPGCGQFSVMPSGTMSPELASKFPEIVSLKGTSKEERSASLRLDYDGKELNAEIIWNGTSYIIAPWKKGKQIYYLVYRKEDSGTEKKPLTER